MKHNFNHTDTVQWGERGLSETAACSYFKCSNCGQGFEHRYNEMPSIYEAMKKQGVDLEDCPGAKPSEVQEDEDYARQCENEKWRSTHP